MKKQELRRVLAELRWSESLKPSIEFDHNGSHKTASLLINSEML